MPLCIKSFTFNMFGVNTYIVWESESREAMIVDPGMVDVSEQQALDSYITLNGLTVVHIINTHMHLDHIFGNDAATGRYNVPVEAHAADAPLGINREAQARQFGIRGTFRPQHIGRLLDENTTITLGKEQLGIIHIPGHSPGSIALHSATGKFVISGDVIFPGSIGRTDLALGNHRQLIAGIRTKLLTLPADTVIYPGHGTATSVARELRDNPYV